MTNLLAKAYKMLVLVLTIAQVASVLCNNGVPVLLWSSENIPEDVPMPLAGHSVKGNDFNDVYLKKLGQRKLLVAFVQDELGLEDFIQYGDAYQHVQALMQPESSFTFPSVHDPMAAVRRFAEGFTRVLELNHADNVASSMKGLELATDTLLIVRLHPTVDAESVRSVLLRNDELIGSVAKTLKASGLPYVTLYTTHVARRTRDVIMQDVAGRRLLALSSNSTGNSSLPGFFLSGSVTNGTSCGMLYLDSITLSIETLHNVSITLDKTMLVGSISCLCAVNSSSSNSTQNETVSVPCDGLPANSTILTPKNLTTAIITVSLAHPIMSVPFRNTSIEFNLTHFSIKFTIVQDKRYTSKWWNLTQMDVSLDNTTVTFQKAATALTSITAPFYAAYHCAQQPRVVSGSPIISNVTSNTTSNATCVAPICYTYTGIFVPFNFTFNNLQIQGLRELNASRFDAAYDCASFFTIPTWMGLLTTLVLIIITVFGVSMLAKIETFDQFDDVKGKTIVVTNTD